MVVETNQRFVSGLRNWTVRPMRVGRESRITHEGPRREEGGAVAQVVVDSVDGRHDGKRFVNLLVCCFGWRNVAVGFEAIERNGRGLMRCPQMSKGDGINGRARRGVSYAGRLEARLWILTHCTLYRCTTQLLAGLLSQARTLESDLQLAVWDRARNSHALDQTSVSPEFV